MRSALLLISMLLLSPALKGQRLQDYVLKIPIDKTITDTDLIDQLNTYFQRSKNAKLETSVENSNLSLYYEDKCYCIRNIISAQDLFKISNVTKRDLYLLFK